VKSRLVMIALAIILGLVAAFGVVLYTNGMRKNVVAEHRTIKVLVAEEDIPLGAEMREITAKKLASFKEVPEKYVTSKAITSPEDINGQVLAVPVNEGEQITIDKFKYDVKAGLSFAIPKDQVAISISVDEVKGVSGMIKAGDSVNIIATLSDTRGSLDMPDMTKIILQNVRILAVGSTIAPTKGRALGQKTSRSGAVGSQQMKQTVTLSLTPADSEKLVFAEEKGHVWLSLLPTSETAPVSTSGQTSETVLNE